MGDPGTDRVPSAFHPADNPAAIAHLNMLQAVIARLAGNGAQCKTWCLAIVAALFALAGAAKNGRILAAAIAPILIFGIVDAMYLAQEKAYRGLFSSVVARIRNGTYAIGDCYGLAAPAALGRFVEALGSWSVWPVYLALLGAY